MIPRKLIGMEGRVQLTATPFAAERCSNRGSNSKLPAGTANIFICDESEATGAPSLRLQAQAVPAESVPAMEINFL